MCSRNHVVTRVDNFCFGRIKVVPARRSGDEFVNCMVTVVAADLTSSHGVCSRVWVESTIRIPHGAVHHHMDVFAIANNDFFVDLESYLERKLSEKWSFHLTFRTIRRLAESTSKL